MIFLLLRNPSFAFLMGSPRSKGIKKLTLPSPSMRPNEPIPSVLMPCSSFSSPHQLTPNHPPKRARVSSSLSTSSESSQTPLSPHSDAAETFSETTFSHQRGYDIPKLLEAVASFRLRNGIAPTMKMCIAYFLTEVKDFVPKDLSEKQLLYKLSRLRENFRKEHSPGPDSDDRSFYELGLRAWESPRPRVKRNVGGSVKRNGKSGGLKKKRKVAEECETDEDEGIHWEAEESMELGNDEEVVLVEEGVSLLDKEEADTPYKYLQHALEDFWISKNLDLNALQLALKKVDSVQAKHLDVQFMAIARDELKLKIEKNRLSNDIMNILCRKGW